MKEGYTCVLGGRTVRPVLLRPWRSIEISRRTPGPGLPGAVEEEPVGFRPKGPKRRGRVGRQGRVLRPSGLVRSPFTLLGTGSEVTGVRTVTEGHTGTGPLDSRGKDPESRK